MKLLLLCNVDSDLALVPVTWTKSIIISPDGIPYEANIRQSPLQPAEMTDKRGRTISGRFIPKGTRAVIPWSISKLHTLANTNEIHFRHDGKMLKVPFRAPHSQVFFEIDEQASMLPKDQLFKWLAGNYNNDPIDRSMPSPKGKDAFNRALEPSHLS